MNNTLLKSIKFFLKEVNSLSEIPNTVTSINTDSRSIKEGDLFIAIKGENFDGHKFIYDALDKGACLAIAEEGFENIPSEHTKKIILAKSSLEAYHRIANIYRTLVNPLCIGITGSSGKTTTKEILKAALGNAYRVHATEANYNNEIGVPKTILSMPEDTQVLILEMAMRGLKEIELLSNTGNPNIALITNVGTTHIELLGSKDNIRKAKLEILSGISDYKGFIELASTFVIDKELYEFLSNREFIDPNTNKKIQAKNIYAFDSQANFKINGLISEGINADINAIAIVARLLGLKDETIQENLLKYNPGKGRGEFLKDRLGNIFIDETYNANPEAVINSANALVMQFKEERKIAAIGDILESEPSLITELFSKLKALESVDSDFTLIDARNRSIEDISAELKSKLDSEKKNIVLVKASRGAKLERLLEDII